MMTWIPGRLTVESDYLELARKLLEGTVVEPIGLRLETPQARTLAIWIEGPDLAHELAAAELLHEYWLYDWMPCNVEVVFVPARLGRDEQPPDA